MCGQVRGHVIQLGSVDSDESICAVGEFLSYEDEDTFLCYTNERGLLCISRLRLPGVDGPEAILHILRKRLWLLERRKVASLWKGIN